MKTIEVKTYNLPDLEPLLMDSVNDELCAWIPDKNYLVLGKGNQPDKSLHLGNVIDDNVEVVKRPSGGETVILTPNTLVLSAVKTISSLENPVKYFRVFNERVISNLKTLGVTNLHQKGISDISIGNKKILGSSIYRTKNKIFYHAVLNVSESIGTIEKYIKHPSREPDYRQGRSHTEFVTSLHSEGYTLDIFTLKNELVQDRQAA